MSFHAKHLSVKYWHINTIYKATHHYNIFGYIWWWFVFQVKLFLQGIHWGLRTRHVEWLYSYSVKNEIFSAPY